MKWYVHVIIYAILATGTFEALSTLHEKIMVSLVLFELALVSSYLLYKCDESHIQKVR